MIEFLTSVGTEHCSVPTLVVLYLVLLIYMAFSLGTNKISGQAFRKMVTKASGHSKFLSSDVKKALGDMKARKYLKDDAKVSKQQAIQVMKGLRAKGLAHKVTSDATTYVHKGFRHEEMRQENIRKQNLVTRAKEIAEEHNAELAKSGKSEYKPVAGTQTPMARQAAPTALSHKLEPTHTPIKPARTPNVAATTAPAPTTTSNKGLTIQKPPEETIDLAID